MNMETSVETDLLVSTVRRFVETEMYPHEEDVDRLGHVPEEIGRQIEAKSQELGLFACNLPEAVGGGGLGYGAMSLIEREYGRTSHALQSWAARPTELLMACEGDQRDTYLLPAVRGEKRELFALTEPDAGSDVMGMKTNAKSGMQGPEMKCLAPLRIQSCPLPIERAAVAPDPTTLVFPAPAVPTIVSSLLARARRLPA